MFPDDLLQHLKDYRKEFYETAKQTPRRTVDDFITALSTAIEAQAKAWEEFEQSAPRCSERISVNYGSSWISL